MRKKKQKHYPGGYDPGNFDIGIWDILRYYSLNLKYYEDAAETIFQVLNGKINPIIQCYQFFVELCSAQFMGKCISNAVVIYMDMIIRNGIHDIYKYDENDPNLNAIAHDMIMCELLEVIAHELAHFNQKYAFSGSDDDDALYLYVEKANEEYTKDYLRSNLDWIERATGFTFIKLRYKISQSNIESNNGLYPVDLKIARPHSYTNYRFYDIEEYIAIELANLCSNDGFNDALFQKYLKMIRESENIFFRGTIKASDDVSKSPFKNFMFTSEITPLKLNWWFNNIDDFLMFISNVYGDIKRQYTTLCRFTIKTSYCQFTNNQFTDMHVNSINALYIEITSVIEKYMPVAFDKRFLSEEMIANLQDIASD